MPYCVKCSRCRLVALKSTAELNRKAAKAKRKGIWTVEEIDAHLRNGKEMAKVFAGAGAKYLSKKQAIKELHDAVYNASQLIETLEGAGKIRGNGHHVRQELSAMAAKLLGDRWRE